MTLLDKQTCLYKSGLALLLIPFFFACDDPSQIGVEVPNTDDQYEVQKAEFTLPVSTISIDSLRTDNTSFSLFGKYSDPITGTVSATSYNRYKASGGYLPEESDLQVRAYAVLRVNNYRQNDNAENQELFVHEAQDSLFSSVVYLADRVVPYDETPVASSTFTFNVDGEKPDTIISFELTENFADFHYQLLLRSKANTESRDSLTGGDYFRKPLVFAPGENNVGLYSIDLLHDTTGIYIEMVDTDPDTTYYYKFSFDSKHYSHLDRDRSTAQLSDLTEEYQESANAGDFSYIDVISGVYPKADLSSMISFIEEHENMIINSAVLTTQSADNNPDYVDPFNSLQFLFVKNSGRINGPGLLTNMYENSIMTDASYINNSNFLAASTSYSDSLGYSPVNMTMFAENLLNNYLNEEDYLTQEVVIFSSASTSLRQTKLINSETKVTLYYTTPKE